jgi:transcriptional regulator with XRE-family HTH domain
MIIFSNNRPGRDRNNILEQSCEEDGVMETVVNMQALGDQVLLQRRHAGLSQQEIAARAGLDTMTISRIESGAKKRLEIETAARLARVLGVSLDQLCGLETPAGDVLSLASAPARPEPGPTRTGRLETPQELTAQILSWHEDEGLTLRAIVQRLNAEGVPTRSGRGQWYLASVAELLQMYGPRYKKDRKAFMARYGPDRAAAPAPPPPSAPPKRPRRRKAAAVA